MKCCACSGLGLGHVVSYQTPKTHTYTPNAPANTPARYLHIPGHGQNQNGTHNKGRHTTSEVYGIAGMVWMVVGKYYATGGAQK